MVFDGIWFLSEVFIVLYHEAIFLVACSSELTSMCEVEMLIVNFFGGSFSSSAIIFSVVDVDEAIARWGVIRAWEDKSSVVCGFHSGRFKVCINMEILSNYEKSNFSKSLHKGVKRNVCI